MERRKLELVTRARQANRPQAVEADARRETSTRCLRAVSTRGTLIAAMTGKTISSVLVCALGLASIVGVRRRRPRDRSATRRRSSRRSRPSPRTARRPAKVARRTIVTENEVNSYLVYEAREQIPVGVVDPSIADPGPGRVSGRADRRSRRGAQAEGADQPARSDELPDGTAAGHGDRHAEDRQRRRPLRARVGERRQRADSRRSCCRKSSATTRARRRSRPASASTIRFALPARIREIQVERGQAIIVQ